MEGKYVDMKASLTTFISNLSDDNFEVFEEIVLHKYKKFIKFYWLVKPYSEEITKMKYNFSSQNILDVDITFTKKIDMSIIEEKLNESEYDVECKIEKNKMKLNITCDE